MIKKYKKLISVTGPSITKREIDYVARAMKDGWNENAVKYVTLFEKKFLHYIGRKYAVATSSCTGALHLSYLALGIKKGDEVIAPNISWVASVEPLYYIGAKVVYADINSRTWCIDPASVEKHVTKKTKAIVLVDLYGSMPEMNKILAIAKKYNLKIIEDAAEAVGSEYHGKKAGSFGDVSCFSFHGSKTLVTGEGGMLLTDSEEIAQKARYYNDHCKDPKKLFWNLEIGYKYKMSNLQAACGLAQLERVEELIAKKRLIFSWYKKELTSVSGITLNVEPPYTKNTYWMITIVFDKSVSMSKEKIITKFQEYNIQTRPFFYPISSLPAIYVQAKTPIAFDISERAINLPCGQQTTKAEVHYVCEVLKELLNDIM